MEAPHRRPSTSRVGGEWPRARGAGGGREQPSAAGSHRRGRCRRIWLLLTQRARPRRPAPAPAPRRHCGNGGRDRGCRPAGRTAAAEARPAARVEPLRRPSGKGRCGGWAVGGGTGGTGPARGGRGPPPTTMAPLSATAPTRAVPVQTGARGRGRAAAGQGPRGGGGQARPAAHGQPRGGADAGGKPTTKNTVAERGCGWVSRVDERPEGGARHKRQTSRGGATRGCNGQARPASPHPRLSHAKPPPRSRSHRPDRGGEGTASGNSARPARCLRAGAACSDVSWRSLAVGQRLWTHGRAVSWRAGSAPSWLLAGKGGGSGSATLRSDGCQR